MKHTRLPCLCLCLLLVAVAAIGMIVSADSAVTTATTTGDRDGDIDASSPTSTVGNDQTNNDGLTDEERALLDEIIAEGRGHREEQGVRDQWESDEHLRDASKYKIHKPLSSRVTNLLQQYHLDCDDCNEVEAVAKINAFVKETKELAAKERKRLKQQQRRHKQLKGTAIFASIVAIIVGGGLLYLDQQQQGGGHRLGGGGSGSVDQNTRRLQEIQAQRQRAEEEMMKQALESKKSNGGPSWHEQEAKEIWTTKQIKQFDKALIAFGGVPPKARYGLIADKVDGKTRNECLLHHKYIEWLKKQQKEEK